MGKIKVLFLETHMKDGKDTITHGVDFARVVNPANSLKDHPDFEVECRKDPIKNNDGTDAPQKNWDEVTKYYDIIFTSYIDFAPGYTHLGYFTKKNNIPHVMDVDDNLWEIPKHSPTYNFFHPGSDRLNVVSLAMEDTPYITTTNLFLKYRLVKYLSKGHEKIKTLPNYIDLSIYNFRNITPKKNKQEILISYYGTNTHTKDVMDVSLNRALMRLMREHPNVYFETTGFFLPQMKTVFKKQYRHRLGKKNFYDWVKLWEVIMGEADICIAPLENTDFNKSKSNIKYLEYSAGKLPGVYQDIRQYKEMVKTVNGTPTGFLASTEEEWYKNLKALVVSEELRKKVGEAAYQYVKTEHTMQGHVEDYADFFKKVYETHKQYGGLLREGFILPGQEVM